MQQFNVNWFYVVIVGLFVFMMLQYRHLHKYSERREYRENFMDAIKVDPKCANMTASRLLQLYNGNFNKLTNDMHSIGVTPDIAANPVYIPKIATALMKQGIIQC
jgi:hypothetical protein